MAIVVGRSAASNLNRPGCCRFLPKGCGSCGGLVSAVQRQGSCKAVGPAADLKGVAMKRLLSGAADAGEGRPAQHRWCATDPALMARGQLVRFRHWRRGEGRRDG